VRPILKAYEGKDIPNEYAKKEAEAKRVAVQEWERLHPSSMHGAGSGLLSSVFGSIAAVCPNILYRMNLTFHSLGKHDPTSR